MKNSFLEGFLFRPQGKPMVYPYTLSAKISQFPYRQAWHYSWLVRYFTYSVVFVVFPLYWQIDKKLTGEANKKFWKEKRRADAEHHRHEMEKIWEIRT